MGATGKAITSSQLHRDVAGERVLGCWEKDLFRLVVFILKLEYD